MDPGLNRWMMAVRSPGQRRQHTHAHAPYAYTRANTHTHKHTQAHTHTNAHTSNKGAPPRQAPHRGSADESKTTPPTQHSCRNNPPRRLSRMAVTAECREMETPGAPSSPASCTRSTGDNKVREARSEVCRSKKPHPPHTHTRARLKTHLRSATWAAGRGVPPPAAGRSAAG
jgi:hypothetical protein